MLLSCREKVVVLKTVTYEVRNRSFIFTWLEISFSNTAETVGLLASCSSIHIVWRCFSTRFFSFYNLHCRFLDVRQHSFVAEWKITTSTVPGKLFSVPVFCSDLIRILETDLQVIRSKIEQICCQIRPMHHNVSR